ncbi:MAG: alpha/beta fold hydrolase [Nitrosomonas sp.]|nr:alpha/beta fold hydrolase [Nitrosomonas sp.]
MGEIKFTNRRGLALAGNLELPTGGSPRAFALFAHCFSCTRHSRAAVYISRAMAAQGVAVLRFDFTGLGQSEGDFADSGFSANIDDLLSAADWLAANHRAPELLVGHSLGGTAVLAAAMQMEHCRAVATINAPAEVKHVLRHMQEDLAVIEQDGSALVELDGRPFRITRAFIDDMHNQEILAHLSSMKPALLVMHTPIDKIVSVDNAQAIFAAARHPKSFISLDQADHLLSNTRDAQYAGQVIASWVDHYLDKTGDHTDEREASTEPVEGAIVNGRLADGFTCRIRAGRHDWIADEPEAMEGRDLGPDPYAHLCAALASCTVMTLNLYARHKTLPVTEVEVHVRHHRIHAKDCEDCDSADGMIDQMKRTIHIAGDLDDKQRQRMLEIANRCPVHQTLTGEMRITSVLATS